MDASSIATIMGAASVVAGSIGLFIMGIFKLLKLRGDIARQEEALRRKRYTRDSLNNVAKMVLVVSGVNEITPESIKLAKQLHYGVLDDVNNREIIDDFETAVMDLIYRKGDALRDEIRRNTLIPIAGITND